LSSGKIARAACTIEFFMSGKEMLPGLSNASHLKEKTSQFSPTEGGSMSVEEQSSAGQMAALNQLGALGASEQPDVQKILHDPSLSAYDRVYMAVSTVVDHLDEEITQHLDALRDTNDFDGEMAKYRELNQKRTELQDTMTRLYEEENERLRNVIQSD
jgi:hypothetical protein